MAAPTVTTQAASEVVSVSFIGNGNITATGGTNASRRGFCYKVGTSGDPVIATDSLAYDDGSFSTGAYTKTITGLTAGTGYRVRAYATNPDGTSYGTTVQVTMAVSLTLLELKAMSRASLDEATAALFTDANILAWINAAERDIAVKSGCIEVILSLETVPYTRLVAFTGDKVNSVELVTNSSTAFLVGGEVNWEDTDDTKWQDTNDTVWYDSMQELWIPYPPYSGIRVTPHNLGHVSLRDLVTPQYWFQWGQNIVIEPIPYEVYTLNVYVSKSPSDQMSTDTHVPQIPLEFQECIVPYVVFMGKMKERKYKDAGMKYQEYLIILQGLIDRYIRRKPARIADIRLPDLIRSVK